MYCELNPKFRHSRFTFLPVLRTYLCSCGFTNQYTLVTSVDYHSQMYSMHDPNRCMEMCR